MMAREGCLRAAGAAVVVLLSVACSTPEPVDPWGRGMGGALAIRAEDLLAEGRRDEAREAAAEALALPDGTLDDRSRARAMTVLGKLDDDLELLLSARDLLMAQAPPPATWEVRLLVADRLLDAGRLEQALEELDEVVAEAEEHPEHVVRALHEAPGRRLRSAALRRLGRLDEARADDRRAALVLSLVPDDVLPDLRLALALVLGDDALAMDRPAEAYALHARARTLAAALGNGAAETRALLTQSRALAAQGRFHDAADRALLTAEQAREVDEPELARRAALEGLGWADDAGQALDDHRRLALLAVLRELDAAVAGDG
jgi:tetratricopeptide (TPR) repeat protein